MLYAILCYDNEKITSTWPKERDEAVLAQLRNVENKLAKEGRLGPVARLMPTTTATSLRKGKDTMVLDGPFAETKEQLLGFFVVDCASLEDAIAAGKEFAAASGSAGTYEIRPLAIYRPGVLGPEASSP